MTLAIRRGTRILGSVMCQSKCADLAGYVLDYLIDHEQAGDTLEGIVDWWLLEQQVKYQTTAVEEVMEDLVKRELIIERKGLDSRSHYRINPQKYGEVCALLHRESP